MFNFSFIFNETSFNYGKLKSLDMDNQCRRVMSWVCGAIASPDPNLRVLTAQLVAITGGDILSPTGPLQHITQTQQSVMHDKASGLAVKL